MHSVYEIIKMETAVAIAMLSNKPTFQDKFDNNKKDGDHHHQLHIVMEHFSFEMQDLLDDY